MQCVLQKIPWIDLIDSVHALETNVNDNDNDNDHDNL